MNCPLRLAQILLCVTLLAVCSFGWGTGSFTPSASASLTSASSSTSPTAVTIGTYINHITQLSLKNSSFVADFYLWFRVKGTELEPWNTFEITNGEIQLKEVTNDTMIGDERYVCLHIIARMDHNFKITRFPLDNHTLSIRIEDATWGDHKLVYVADEKNSWISPDVETPGWRIEAAPVSVGTTAYKSNLGDTSLPTGSVALYSLYRAEVSLVRANMGKAIATFMALLVAMLTSFVALYIKPTYVDPRFGLPIGGLFASVASHYMTSDTLPASSFNTLFEWQHVVAIGFIFIVVAESAYVLHLHENRCKQRAMKVDRVCRIVLPVLYLLIGAGLMIFYQHA